jgi:hypothetical protein
MQFTDRFVTIFDGPRNWWPEGVEKTMSPDALIEAFKAVGFTLCDNRDLEESFDKVVLYKNEVKNEWTHAARIISETTEHSKFGESFDGTHSHGVFCGTIYGIPYAFMKRSKSFTIKEKSLTGNIETNLELLRRLLKK